MGLQVSISTIDKYIPDAVKRAIHDFMYLAIITILPIKYIQKDNKTAIYIYYGDRNGWAPGRCTRGSTFLDAIVY